MLPVPTTNSDPSVRMRTNTTPSTDMQSVTMTKKCQPAQMKTLEPDAKGPTRIPRPQQVKLPNYINNYVVCDAEELIRLGWTEFVRRQQGSGSFASLSELENPERRVLHKYKHCGALVVLMMGG